jgi:hypothetical protein
MYSPLTGTQLIFSKLACISFRMVNTGAYSLYCLPF